MIDQTVCAVETTAPMTSDRNLFPLDGEAVMRTEWVAEARSMALLVMWRKVVL